MEIVVLLVFPDGEDSDINTLQETRFSKGSLLVFLKSLQELLGNFLELFRTFKILLKSLVEFKSVPFLLRSI